MSNVIVSVIIPNYNHARFFKERIDSVLAQTFQDFEIIILDDYSVDSSREIIAQYENNVKISHVVFNETNSGSAFQQWKKGIGLAKGNWIWIAESDDYCDPTLLASLVDNAKKNSGVVLSYCQSYFREEGNQTVRDMRFHSDPVDAIHWNQDYCNEGIDEIRRFLLHRNTIPNASAVLFKKSAYEQVDKYFEQMKQCGDWLLWVKLLALGKVAFCATPLNNFRAHSATTRVYDTVEKKRIRLQEEYKIVSEIKKCIGASGGASADIRLNELSEEFALSFTKRDIFKFLLWPFSYKGKIPYSVLMTSKIKTKFN